jgi:hypothetical protein
MSQISIDHEYVVNSGSETISTPFLADLLRSPVNEAAIPEVESKITMNSEVSLLVVVNVSKL